MSLTVSASGITFNDLTTLSTASISASNLAPSSVGTLQLSAQAVTTDKIALGAVITEDLANGAVTAAKLNGGQSGSAPIYGCRAWVNFDGTRDSTGTISTVNTNRLIRASGNVSSVTRIGLGCYEINFTTNMPDANYSVVGASTSLVGTAVSNVITAFNRPTDIRVANTSAKTTISTCNSQNSTSIEVEDVNIAIFR